MIGGVAGVGVGGNELRPEEHRSAVDARRVGQRAEAAGGELDQGVGHRAGVVVGEVGRDIDVQPLVRRVAHRDAARGERLRTVVAQHAAVADGVGRHVRARVGAGVVVSGDVAVVVLGRRRDADEQLVRDHREVGRGAGVQAVQAAVGAFDVAAVIAVRLQRIELDGAADGVLAGQGALRPALDLDPVQVEQVQQRPRHGGEVDVVDIDADARLQGQVEVGLADAADEGHHRGAEGRAVGGQGHVGGLGRHVGKAALVAIFEHLGVDRRDGDRGLFQALLAELGGDHHLAHGVVRLSLAVGVRAATAGRRGRGLRMGGRAECGQGGRGDRRSRTQQKRAHRSAVTVHVSVPHLCAPRVCEAPIFDRHFAGRFQEREGRTLNVLDYSVEIARRPPTPARSSLEGNQNLARGLVIPVCLSPV